MVAAEAAATGALPVCADHSGLAEVAGTLAAALPAPRRHLTAFPLAGEPVGGIADRVDQWLELPLPERREAGAALTATVRSHWSWEGVARTVLAASAGELDALTPVPEPG
jgi:glycosyltransferase involved in cell wall biosynthesis